MSEESIDEPAVGPRELVVVKVRELCYVLDEASGHYTVFPDLQGLVDFDQIFLLDPDRLVHEHSITRSAALTHCPPVSIMSMYSRYACTRSLAKRRDFQQPCSRFSPC